MAVAVNAQAAIPVVVAPREDSRILRECAVDLIRASDLSEPLSTHRIRRVIRDLELMCLARRRRA